MKYSFRIFIAVATFLVLETSAHPFGVSPPRYHREEWGISRPKYQDQHFYPQHHPGLQFDGYNFNHMGPVYHPAIPNHIPTDSAYSLALASAENYGVEPGLPTFQSRDGSRISMFHVPLLDSESSLQLPASGVANHLKIIHVDSQGNPIEDSHESGEDWNLEIQRTMKIAKDHANTFISGINDQQGANFYEARDNTYGNVGQRMPIESEYKSERSNDDRYFERNHRRPYETNARDRKVNTLTKVSGSEVVESSGVSSNSSSSAQQMISQQALLLESQPVYNRGQKTQRNNDDNLKDQGYQTSLGRTANGDYDGRKPSHILESQQHYNRQPIPQIQPKSNLQYEPFVKPAKATPLQPDRTPTEQPAPHITYHKQTQSNPDRTYHSVKPDINQPSVQPATHPKSYSKQTQTTKYSQQDQQIPVSQPEQPVNYPQKVLQPTTYPQRDQQTMYTQQNKNRNSPQSEQPINYIRDAKPQMADNVVPITDTPTKVQPNSYDGGSNDSDQSNNNDEADHRQQQLTNSQLTNSQPNQNKINLQSVVTNNPVSQYPENNNDKPLEQRKSSSPSSTHANNFDDSGVSIDDNGQFANKDDVYDHPKQPTNSQFIQPVTPPQKGQPTRYPQKDKPTDLQPNQSKINLQSVVTNNPASQYPENNNEKPLEQKISGNPTATRADNFDDSSLSVNDNGQFANKDNAYYHPQQPTNSQLIQPVTPPQKGQPTRYPQKDKPTDDPQPNQNKINLQSVVTNNPASQYPENNNEKPLEQKISGNPTSTHANNFYDSSVSVDDNGQLSSTEPTNSQPIQPVTPPQKGQPTRYPQKYNPTYPQPNQNKINIQSVATTSPPSQYPENNDDKPLEQGVSDSPDHLSHLDDSGDPEDFYDITTTNDHLNGYDGRSNSPTNQSPKNNFAYDQTSDITTVQSNIDYPGALVDPIPNQTTKTIYGTSQTTTDSSNQVAQVTVIDMNNQNVCEDCEPNKPDIYNSYSDTNDNTPSQPIANNSAVPLANNSPVQSSPVSSYPDPESISSSPDDLAVSSSPFKDTAASISPVDSSKYNSPTYKPSIKSSAPTPAPPNRLSFIDLFGSIFKPQSIKSSPVQPATQQNAKKTGDATTTQTDNNIRADSKTAQDNETGPGDGNRLNGGNNKSVNPDDGKGSVSPSDYTDGTSDDSLSAVAVQSVSQAYGTDNNGASDGITSSPLTSVDEIDNAQSNTILAQKSKSTDVAQKSTTDTTATQSNSDVVEKPDLKTAAIQFDEGEDKKYGSVAEKSKSVVAKKSDSDVIQESTSVVPQTSAVDVASSTSGNDAVVTDATNTNNLKEPALAIQAFKVFIKKVCEEPKIKAYIESSFLKPIVHVLNTFVKDTDQGE